MAPKPNFYGEVRNAIERELLSQGCSRKRRGIYSYPINAETVGFVGLNESKWRGKVRLEINPVVGVVNLTLLNLLEKLSGKSQHPLPPQVSRPLGYLMPDPHFRNWVFTPDVEVASIARDLADNVMRYGLTWIQEYDSLERLCNALKTGRLSFSNDRSLPCALFLLGQRPEAEECLATKLAEAAQSGGAYLEDFRQFADRLREEMSHGQSTAES